MIGHLSKEPVITKQDNLTKRKGAVTSLWRRLHRWIGLSVSLLLVPIAVTGSLLVWRDHVDAMISPHLFAISGTDMQPLTRYLASAASAGGSDFAPAAIRLPRSEGWPVRVVLRKINLSDRDDLERERIVYLDPPTARVLGIVNPRTGFTGTIRRLHRDLLLPDWSGRQIVGWTGVGLLLLILTGVWLWWPRGSFVSGLRWQRSPRTSLNLHYASGFWVAVPLAVAAFTGIYLAFPQTARNVTATFVDYGPRENRGDRNARVEARLDADQAATILQQQNPTAKLLSLQLPLPHRNEKKNSGPQILWHLYTIDHNGNGQSFYLNDATSALTPIAPPSAGNRVTRIVHQLHEGDGFGAIWSVVVFTTGILPALLAITGLMMWLRGRRNRSPVIQRSGAGGGT